MIQNFIQSVDDRMQETLDNVHTAIPAEILSFDPEKCTAKINLIGKFKKPDGSKIDFPQVANVPVTFMQACGQESAICYPIKPGDGCLAIFSEQCLEAWRSGGDSLFDLKHDLTNAIVIMGTCRKPNPLMKEANDQDAILIRHKDAKIKLSNDEVLVERGKTQHLKCTADKMEMAHNGTTLILNDAECRLIGNLEVEGTIHATKNIQSDHDIHAKKDMYYDGTIHGSKCP